MNDPRQNPFSPRKAARDWSGTRLRQLRATLRRWRRDDGSLIAASMAYYAVLSFFPLLLLLIAALGFVLEFSPGAQDAEKGLLRVLAQNTSPGLEEHVRTAMQAIQTNAVIGGPVGLATLLVAAIGIFTQFDVAMDRIWNIPPRRSQGVTGAIRHVLFHRLRAFLMLLGVGALVWVAFIAGTVASVLRHYMAGVIGGNLAWALLHATLSLVVNGALLTVLYKTLPRTRVSWSAALRGGILAAVLWEVSREALAILMFRGNYTAYGVVGSLMALMLWVYIAASVFFFAAEYVRVIEREPEGDKDSAE
jgi:membrane protein